MYTILIILAVFVSAIVLGVTNFTELSISSVAFLIFLGFFCGLIVGFAFSAESDEDDWEESGF